MALQENINDVQQKTDYTITFQYQNSDNTDRALTGATVFFTVRDNAFADDSDNSEAIISTKVTSHTDAANGITEIALTDADTNIDPLTYHYEIVVVESDGNRYKAKRGRFEVEPSVGYLIS